MTDTASLSYGLSTLRKIVEGKNTLEPKAAAAYRVKVSGLADRVYFNLGWRAAAPDKELKGSAATTDLWEEIHRLTNELSGHVKSPKKAGRPAKVTLGDMLILAEFNRNEGKVALRDCVRTVFKIPGALPDQSIDTVTRRIERLWEKFRPAYERTKNVIQFRPKKQPRQKPK